MSHPTKNPLIDIANEVEQKYYFPNCISAVDGNISFEHFVLEEAVLSFLTIKIFSVVLLAFVDANYKFIMVDIDSFGKEGDSGVIEKSDIGNFIRNEDFISLPRQVNRDFDVPHVIVGDEAFKLATHMMKPYSRIVARKDPHTVATQNFLI